MSLPKLSATFVVRTRDARSPKRAQRRPGTVGAVGATSTLGGAREREPQADSPPSDSPPRSRPLTSSMAQRGTQKSKRRARLGGTGGVRFEIKRPQPLSSGQSTLAWAMGASADGGSRTLPPALGARADSGSEDEGNERMTTYSEIHSLRVRRERNEQVRQIKARASASIAAREGDSRGASRNAQALWEVPAGAGAAERPPQQRPWTTATAQQSGIGNGERKKGKRTGRSRRRRRRAPPTAAGPAGESDRVDGDAAAESRPSTAPAAAARVAPPTLAELVGTEGKDEQVVGIAPPIFPSTALSLDFQEQMCFVDRARTIPQLHMQLSGWAITTEHLKKIAALTPDVRLLNLNGCATINDASMGQMHLLRHLQTLDVEGCSITDRGVLALRKANGRITSLNLSGMTLSDSALELLVHGCNKLVSLQIRGCHGITDKGLGSIGESLKSYNRLRELDLSGCRRISDRGMLAFLAHGRDLTSLKVAECPGLTDLFLMAFASRATASVRLRTIDLHGLRVHDSGLGWLAQTGEYLEEVDLSDCADITEVGLRLLGTHNGCRMLRVLNCRNCPQIEDNALHGFLSLKGAKLEDLNLSGCIDVTDAGMVHIAKFCPNLRALDLSGACRVADDGLLRLARGCRKLTTLVIAAQLNGGGDSRKSRIPRVSDVGLRNLGEAPGLRHLSISLARITDRGVQSLVQRNPYFEGLNFNQCDQLSDAGLQAIGLTCAGLQELVYCGTQYVTDKGLRAIVEGCPQLKKLNLRGSTNLSDSTVVQLAQHCPQLETLCMSSCEDVTDASLIALSKHVYNLHQLDFQNIRSISHVGLAALADVRFKGAKVVAGCPNLSSVRISDSQATEREIQSVALRLPFARSAGMRKGLVAVSRKRRAQNTLVWHMYVEEIAIVSVQSLVRGYFSRKRTEEMKRERERQRQKRRAKALLDIQRVGRGYNSRKLARERKRIRDERIALENLSASTVQSCYRMYHSRKRFRLMVGEIGRKSAIMRDRRYIGATEVQRVFRGNRSRVVVHRMWCAKMCLAISAQQIWRGHVGRARARRQAEFVAQCGGAALTVQRYFRGYLGRKFYKKKRSIEDAAVAFIQRIWRSHRGRREFHRLLVERSVAAHTVQCCAYGYLQIQEAQQHVRDIRQDQMQRRWAVHTIESAFWEYLRKMAAIRAQHRKEFWAASRITVRWARMVRYIRAARVVQGVYRGRLGRRRAILQKKLNAVLGQRTDNANVAAFRRNRMLRHGSALRIQQWAREILVRIFAEQRRIARQAVLVIVCQSWYRGKMARRWVREFKDQVYKMANRIQNMYRNWKNYKVFCAQYRAKKVKEREAIVQYKVDALQERENKFGRMIEHKGREKSAQKIQRVFRKFHLRLEDFRKEKEKQKALAVREEELERRAQARRDKAETDSLWINKLKKKKGQMFDGDDLDDTTLPKPSLLDRARDVLLGEKYGTDEKEMIDHSVMLQQTTMIDKYGLTHVHLTTGMDEKVAFKHEQDECMRCNMPFFALIDKDLSNRKNLGVFLWVKYGRGIDCLTDLQMVTRPVGGKMNQQERLHLLQQQGIKVMPIFLDHKYPFEFHALSHAKKHMPVIKDIVVSTTEDEFNRFQRREQFTQIKPELGRFGGVFDTGVCLWEKRDNVRRPYTLKKAEGITKTAEYNKNTAPFYNAELEKVMDFLYIKEDEIQKLWNLFKKMDITDSNKIFLDDMCEYLNEPTPDWTQGIFRFVDVDPKGMVEFSQFVHAVGVFCMFEKEEMYHFCFTLIDQQRDGFIDSSEFQQLIKMLGDQSAVASRVQMERAFRRFDEVGAGKVDARQFIDLVKHYPSLVYPPFQLQMKLRTCALGEHYWKDKQLKFMKGRQRANDRVHFEEQAFLDKYRKEHAKPKEINLLTQHLDETQQYDLFHAFDLVGARSRVAVQFRHEFKYLSKEVQHETVAALRKIGSADGKKEVMLTVIDEQKEAKKQKIRGLSLRQQQMALAFAHEREQQLEARETGHI